MRGGAARSKFELGARLSQPQWTKGEQSERAVMVEEARKDGSHGVTMRKKRRRLLPVRGCSKRRSHDSGEI